MTGSEQLIPMFGLVNLMHALNPQSTIEKTLFLIEYAPLHMHKVTTLVSFTALAVLVVLRLVKTGLKRYTWIYRLPEVLIVVVVSTCGYYRFLSSTWRD